MKLDRFLWDLAPLFEIVLGIAAVLLLSLLPGALS